MSSRTRILAASLAATLALPLVLTAPAAGAPDPAPDLPGWGPVKTLVAHPRGEALAIDARGAVTVVWATGSTPGSVVALRRPAGGSWGDPVVIGHGTQPQVATDRRGTVTVAWLTRRAGRTDGVAVARHPAGGHWTTPVRLTSDAATPYAVDEVVLDVNPAGDVVVAWTSRDRRDRPWRARSAYRPKGGPWSGPVAVTPRDGSRHPQVGLDDEGRGLLLLCRQRFGHPQVLKTRERSLDGTWTDPVVVTREGYDPVLAVDATGDALVAFSPDFSGVAAAFRPADGQWQRAQALSPEGVDVADFALAVNGVGEAVVALGRVNGRVDVMRRPVAGPWSAAERVVAAGDTVYDVLVALDDAGDTFLGWGGYALLGAYQPGGGAWAGSATISPDAGVEVLESTHAQIGPNGDVAVLWKQEARPLKVRTMSAGAVP